MALANVVLVIMLVTLPIYVLRLNGAAGMMVDDAWYMLLAKSLAEGSGYKLISSAAVAILPLYPPGIPRRSLARVPSELRTFPRMFRC